MSYLLFLDESGHDHRNLPYEVRGGVALRARRLWPFVRGMMELEQNAFGDLLHHHRVEIKGHRLLDKDRFKWARQDDWMDDLSRRKHALGFLASGGVDKAPRRHEFTAYGQACLVMARGIFQLLREQDAVLFAVAIPKSVVRPDTFEAAEFLRKDQVFLLERYFYFLDRADEAGLLVMDETEKTEDRRFVRRLERYFTQTYTGRYRTSRIVPSPFFVSSDMTYPIQAADVCIYCVNWGFRLPSRGMDAPMRQEIAEEFGPWLHALRFVGEGNRDGETFRVYGIDYVPDPYTKR
ncbi:MAG: DUF3800 domain-containing protein [Deltaproteobacteria bacterium]|nr:DUF3800 domain-containing protein [Deltaproteobacteria bacterium]